MSGSSTQRDQGTDINVSRCALGYVTYTTRAQRKA